MAGKWRRHHDRPGGPQLLRCAGELRGVKTRNCLIAVGLVLASFLNTKTVVSEEIVRFSGPSYPPSQFALERAKIRGETLKPKLSDEVVGYITRPGGTGPFPAVILMHGCAGRGKWNTQWQERLNAWGFVVLDLDSFTTRGKTGAQVCFAPLDPGPLARAIDAYGAQAVLKELDFVDERHISVMGMSHGGSSVLQAIGSQNIKRLGVPPFHNAVIFYPYCDSRTEISSPALMLIGEEDTWVPVSNCRHLAKANSNFLRYVEFPKVHHGF